MKTETLAEMMERGLIRRQLTYWWNNDDGKRDNVLEFGEGLKIFTRLKKFGFVLILFCVYPIMFFVSSASYNAEKLIMGNQVITIIITFMLWQILDFSEHRFSKDLTRLQNALDIDWDKLLIKLEDNEIRDRISYVLIKLAKKTLEAENKHGINSVQAEFMKDEFRSSHEIFRRFYLCDEKWNKYFDEARELLWKAEENHQANVPAESESHLDQ